MIVAEFNRQLRSILVSVFNIILQYRLLVSVVNRVY